MSNTVDNRVVEMNFNNQQFEKGVSTSMSTLDKLKKSLNFDRAISSTKSLSSALAGFTLGKMADNISSVANRFSAFGIMGMTIIQNLTNAALNFGKTLISSLTIDPIKTGMAEYETLMGSIQTIMANTSFDNTSLAQVNAALQELNAYSDRTIYNFQQMAKNIGTFTAAGIKLDTSVAAIKGIANLAAVSGSNADQASMAMYQLSQALASGSVKLMDWNSVVNAGMGGKIFQEQLKDTARVHGIAIDAIIKKEGSFRESLSTGWLSADILTETLKKFTGDLTAEQIKAMGYTDAQVQQILKLGQTANDAATKVKTFSQLFDTLREAAQSGWGQTWQILIGDFNEAQDMLTNINSVISGFIGASAKSRNELLQAWKDMGGRTIAIKAIGDIFNDLLKILKPIKEAFQAIFPPTTALQLLTISVYLQRIAAAFSLFANRASNIDKIKRVFAGLFAIFDIVRMAVVAVINAIFKLTSAINVNGASILDSAAKIGDWIVNLRNTIKTTDVMAKTLSKLTEGVAKFIAYIKNTVRIVKEYFGKMFDFKVDTSKLTDSSTKFLDTLRAKFQPISSIFAAAGKAISAIFTALLGLTPLFAKSGDIAAKGMGSFLDILTKAIVDFDPQKLIALINGILFGGLLKAFTNFTNQGTNLLSGVTGILDDVRGSLQAYQTNLKADALLKIAIAVGILAVALIAISTVDGAKIATSLAAMAAMFVQLGVAMTALQNSAGGTKAMATMSIGILSIATAMLIMAGAVMILGKMDAKQLMKGMLAIGAIIALMSVASRTISTSSTDLIKGSIGIMVFSVAVKTMTGAVEKLGNIDYKVLQQGLAALGILLAEIGLFLVGNRFGKLSLSEAAGILVLAGAINVVVLAVNQLGNLNPDVLNQGLNAIAAIMVGLTLFIKATSGTGAGSLLALGVSFAILSGSLVVLTGVVERLGNLSWQQIQQGLGALGGALGIIVAAMNLLPKDMIVTSIALVAVAGALYVIGMAMTQMGSMTWDEIARGLVVLAGSLLIIGIALQFMTTALPGAFAMIIMAGALMLLAPALQTMGKMSWEEIAKGLVALAGVFVVLGLAAYVLTPMIPSLFGLAAALAVMGVAAVLTGVGVLALSAGLAALAVSGAAGAASLVILISSIASLLPMLAKQLGLALLSIIDTLVQGAPTLLNGIVILLGVLVTGLAMLIPKLVDLIVQLVTKLTEAIITLTPKIVEAGWEMLKAIFKGAAEHIQDVVELAIDIVTRFIDGISNSIPQLVESGINFIIAYINGLKTGIKDHMAELIVALTELGLAVVQGLVDGMAAADPILREGIKKIGNTIINSIKESLGIASPSTIFASIGIDTIQGFINGILSMATTLGTTIYNFVSSLITGFISRASEFYTTAASYIEQIRLALANGINIILGVVSTLITRLVNQFTTKSKEIYNIGRDIIYGIRDGMKNYIWAAVEQATNLAKSIIKKIKELFDMESPSKVMRELGGNVVEGFANGIDKTTKMAVDSITTLGNETLNGFTNVVGAVNDFVQSNVDMSPTIRPVLDLTDIKNQGGKIADFIDTSGFTIPLSATNLAINASNAINNVPAEPKSIPQNGSQISFTQNNYSPKTLSRFDIYRQTRNQLRMLEQVKG